MRAMQHMQASRRVLSVVHVLASTVRMLQRSCMFNLAKGWPFVDIFHAVLTLFFEPDAHQAAGWLLG
jgi:hypothetical protein